MIYDRRYDGNGKLISERSFRTIAEAVAYYNSLKDPDGQEEPDPGCWNCMNYDPGRMACTINWNNLDESYYNPDDDRLPDDYCDRHETDADAVWEDFFEKEDY